MTRLGIITAALATVAALHFTDRVVAGLVQCRAAQTCPEK